MTDDSREPDREGEDPHEEVGPDGCDPSPAQCAVAPGERAGPPEESDFSVVDEVHEMLASEPIAIMADPVDGLPRPVDPPTHPYAPPFTRLHIVCLGDDRKYVERWEDELQHAMRAQARLQEVVVRSRYDNEGAERERLEFARADVQRRFGCDFAAGPNGLVAVRPIREKCVHYQRQLFNVDGDENGHNPFVEGGKIQFANCAARRSIGGAHMSLSGQAIYACDYRQPPDPKTVAAFLDKFDEARLTGKRHLKMVPAFGMGGDEYEREDIEAEAEGIFRK